MVNVGDDGDITQAFDHRRATAVQKGRQYSSVRAYCDDPDKTVMIAAFQGVGYQHK